MLKFQIATKADLKEAAIIQQKRRYEEERKARIFNARNRIIGVCFIKKDYLHYENDNKTH